MCSDIIFFGLSPGYHKNAQWLISYESSIKTLVPLQIANGSHLCIPVAHSSRLTHKLMPSPRNPSLQYQVSLIFISRVQKTIQDWSWKIKKVTVTKRNAQNFNWHLPKCNNIGLNILDLTTKYSGVKMKLYLASECTRFIMTISSFVAWGLGSTALVNI